MNCFFNLFTFHLCDYGSTLEKTIAFWDCVIIKDINFPNGTTIAKGTVYEQVLFNVKDQTIEFVNWKVVSDTEKICDKETYVCVSQYELSKVL